MNGEGSNSRSTYIPYSLVQETLGSLKETGGRLLEPLLGVSTSKKVPLNILEDVAVQNTPEIHKNEHDLWQCLEGEALFVTGGRMTNQRPHMLPDGTTSGSEIQGDAIENGITYKLTVGDYLFIPAGEPHMHGSATFARLTIVKIPAR